MTEIRNFRTVETPALLEEQNPSAAATADGDAYFVPWSNGSVASMEDRFEGSTWPYAAGFAAASSPPSKIPPQEGQSAMVPTGEMTQKKKDGWKKAGTMETDNETVRPKGGDVLIGATDKNTGVHNWGSSLLGLRGRGNLMINRVTGMVNRGMHITDALKQLNRVGFDNATFLLSKDIQRPAINAGADGNLDTLTRRLGDGSGVNFLYMEEINDSHLQSSGKRLVEALKRKYPKATWSTPETQTEADFLNAIGNQKADNVGVVIANYHGGILYPQNAQGQPDTNNGRAAVNVGGKPVLGNDIAASAGKNPLKQIIWFPGCEGNGVVTGRRYRESK